MTEISWWRLHPEFAEGLVVVVIGLVLLGVALWFLNGVTGGVLP